MPRAAARTLSFSLRASIGADYAVASHAGQWWLTRRAQPLLALAELKIQGLHNAANALAALALGEALALPLPAMLAELRSFTGLAHRSQWVADVSGVTYIDDSKGTNVGATLAAVAGMPGPLLMILGGEGKAQDFAPLAQAFRGKVRHAVLIGRDAAELERALRGVCTVERAVSLEGRCGPPPPWRAPGTRCCCRRPARASTCSATTPIAARCSPQPCGSWRHERRRPHGLCALQRQERSGAPRQRHHRARARHRAARPGDGDLGLGLDRRPGERPAVLLPRAPAAAGAHRCRRRGARCSPCRPSCWRRRRCRCWRSHRALAGGAGARTRARGERQPALAAPGGRELPGLGAGAGAGAHLHRQLRGAPGGGAARLGHGARKAARAALLRRCVAAARAGLRRGHGAVRHRLRPAVPRRRAAALRDRDDGACAAPALARWR